MKFLFASPKNIENSPTFVRHQAAWLHPAGILYGGYRPYRYDGVSIFSFPLRLNIVRILLKNIAKPLYKRFYDKALIRFLKSKNFNVVLCQFGPQGANIAEACYEAGVPMVIRYAKLKTEKNKHFK